MIVIYIKRTIYGVASENFGHVKAVLNLGFWVFFNFQKVQKVLLQSDVQSKTDRSPVTVADYGMFLKLFFLLLILRLPLLS